MRVEQRSIKGGDELKISGKRWRKMKPIERQVLLYIARLCWQDEWKRLASVSRLKRTKRIVTHLDEYRKGKTK